MKRERYHLSVAVFVLLRKGDEICMLRRSGTGWMDGCFSLPAGGLEAGETIKQAAAREAKEEIGIDIAQENLQLSHTLHVWTENRSWMGHFFTCTTWNGVPALMEPDKHDVIAWQAITTLPDNTIPYVRQAVNNIIIHSAYSEFGW